MLFERERRKFYAALNSRYIYGKIPLFHAIVFLIEMAITMRLIAKFNSYYAERPLLTTMITNAILGGIADTTAQILTAYRSRQRNGLASPTVQRASFLEIEIQDLNRDDEKPHRWGNSLIPSSRSGVPPFDFERLTRFMAYGFLMAPLQFKWFQGLSKVFPITKGRGTVPALQRVACDQLIFAPLGLGCFFTFMTVAEGGGKRAIWRKFQDVYVPALKANYLLWPAVQILNFRVVPIQFQIPFVSTIGIAWTAYLSLANSAEEE